MDKNGYVSDAISVYQSIFESHHNAVSFASVNQQGESIEQNLQSVGDRRLSPSLNIQNAFSKVDDVEVKNNEA